MKLLNVFSEVCFLLPLADLVKLAVPVLVITFFFATFTHQCLENLLFTGNNAQRPSTEHH